MEGRNYSKVFLVKIMLIVTIIIIAAAVLKTGVSRRRRGRKLYYFYRNTATGNMISLSYEKVDVSIWTRKIQSVSNTELLQYIFLCKRNNYKRHYITVMLLKQMKIKLSNRVSLRRAHTSTTELDVVCTSVRRSTKTWQI